ncbi:DASH family cryptochrome [Mucilaginibacter sp. UR6-1]|uniref:DASH family cryptochrome n=1 Tax=Mucilaginibacter sp. UR6-1 TaxID=1435643 RepID=UPI001E384C80|nr:DASH family cryptochrome [Mucilaginibacter sp. UR6-1]MCC8410949.1 DASH family cryptochrome [Mucilaginibacter sp. UR6-1]
MSERIILVWFRNDLRVHDNEILLEATRKADKILPVYCFDPQYFKIVETGKSTTGNFRARFLLQSIANLRDNLRKLGGELIIRTGNPAEIIPQLTAEYQVNEVYHHREVASQETAMSEEVEAALWKQKLNLKHFIGHTLYHKEDLPFPIKDIPDSFSVFKKKVERDSSVRPETDTPEQILTPAITDAGELPTLTDLGLDEPVDDPRATIKFTGGECAGIAALEEYFTNNTPVKAKAARNPQTAADNTSRLSPWLAFGCLSPRRVYFEVARHEQGHSNNNPLIPELLWRDYFRFMFKKHGKKFFNPEGFKSEAPETAANQDALFEQWCAGNTGVPYVDAAMHQLNATGYINNYARQIVAGYLVRDLKVNWTRGALYFEEKLIDYSPASNWGNWAFVAGVGNDPRENKNFIHRQVSQLETKSPFIDTWLSAHEAEQVV